MATPATFGGRVVLDPVELNKLLRGPNGPVMRRMMEDGEAVKREARRTAPVSKVDPVPRRKPRRPGTLRDSIVKRVVYERGHPVVQVGSDLEYALFVHEGTKPHTITAKDKPLVFFWDKVGQVVRFPPWGRPPGTVHHPGQRPNRWLLRAVSVLRSRY